MEIPGGQFVARELCFGFGIVARTARPLGIET